MQNEGGAEQVAPAWLRRLHRFPTCPAKEKLGYWLGEWEYLKNKHGGNIPDSSLYTMRVVIVPEDVQKEARDRREKLVHT